MIFFIIFCVLLQEYMQKFAKEFYSVESEVRYWKTFKEIKNDILAGFPALVSVGLLHEFDESFYKEDLESGKGLQNIKNYAYHLYANIKLSAVENKDFDNKNTELEKTVKKLEEKLSVVAVHSEILDKLQDFKLSLTNDNLINKLDEVIELLK